jgi:hypothetical protein
MNSHGGADGQVVALPIGVPAMPMMSRTFEAASPTLTTDPNASTRPDRAASR